MVGDKLRLYLAYYARTPTPNNAEKYHTSFLLVPKKPKNKTPISILYHVINPIDPIFRKQIWKLETRRIVPRTVRLVGLMLLGKVPPTFTEDIITEIMESIPVKQEPDWRCRLWVWEGLSRLSSKGVIPELPGIPEDVWNNGRSFVEKKTGGAPDHDVWVTTCTMTGNEIASEVAPLDI